MRAAAMMLRSHNSNGNVRQITMASMRVYSSAVDRAAEKVSLVQGASRGMHTDTTHRVWHAMRNCFL